MKMTAKERKEITAAFAAFAERIVSVRADLERGTKDPEASTSALIQELFSHPALGYSVAGGGGMEREWRVDAMDSTDKCDYALWGEGRRSGRPDVLVEVKAATRSLDNRKFQNQLLGYIIRSGVKWGVLTNGVEWRGYALQKLGGGKSDMLPLFSLDLSQGVDDSAVDALASLCRKGLVESMKALLDRARWFTPEVVAAFVLGDKPVKCIVNELERVYKVAVTQEEMRSMLRDCVIGGKVSVSDRAMKEAAVASPGRATAETAPQGKLRSDTTASLPQGDFVLKGRGVEAHGSPIDGGFLVYAGTPVCDPVPSFAQRCASAKKVRDALIADGTIADGRLARDFVFSSPSAAACVIMGRSSNGLKEWRTEDGRALGDAVRP